MKNLKKVIALVAVFALVFTTVTAFASSFVDVADDAAYTEAVEALNKLGIITGDTNDNGEIQFRPEDSVTRAEMAALVARIQAYDASSQQATSFTDVASSHWASGYVAMAAQQGIVNGYGDGTFGPEDPVLYEQVIKMVMVTLGYEPFAAANGGYPTGYSIAASRYGVTDGVTGGVTGQAAPRATIAQILYNAIDTPLMQQYWYGNGNENYIIFDGTNGYDYKTLMSQNLKVTKLRGQLVDNGVTTLTGYAAIDTDDDTTVTVKINGTYNTSNTDYSDIDTDAGEERQFLASDSGIEEYIGQQIVFYVKDNDTLSNPEVISAAPEAGKNKTESFTIDKYDSVDGSILKYYRNDTDRAPARLNIQDGYSLIYNGVGGYKLEDIFGTVVQKDSQVGGKVTLYDTDSTSGYDVIIVEVSATAVVDSVEGTLIQFKDTAGDPTYFNMVSNLTVDADDTALIVNITKDGKAIEYTELAEWDVLSIIYNESGADVYTIEVISNPVDGVISTVSDSETSYTGKKYRIGDNTYDVALNAYNTSNLRAGNAGLFYIDAYGKIAAYNKEGATSTGTASYDNYAYIINAKEDDSAFSNGGQVQMLTAKEGILTLNLASTVTIENSQDSADAHEVFGANANATDYGYKVKNDDAASATLAAMAGMVVKYTKNAANQISKLEFASNKNTENTSALQEVAVYTTAEYDEYNNRFTGTGASRKFVDDSTIVFFVNSTDADAAEVGTAAELAGTYENVKLYDETSAGVAKLVVIDDKNASAGISPASSAIVIDSIGTTTNSEGDNVTQISYYQDGDTTLKTAMESMNFNDNGKAISGYKQGDMALISLNANGEIKSIKPIVTFKRAAATAGEIRDTSDPDAIPVSDIYNNVTDNEVIEGAVVKKSGSRITLYTPTADGFKEGDTYNLSGANVYVYDVSKARNKLTVGAAGSIVVTKALLSGLIEEYPNTDSVTVSVKSGSTYKPITTTPAYGLCDYVYLRTYEDDVVDVLVVKAPDFGTFHYDEIEN